MDEEIVLCQKCKQPADDNSKLIFIMDQNDRVEDVQVICSNCQNKDKN